MTRPQSPDLADSVRREVSNEQVSPPMVVALTPSQFKRLENALHVAWTHDDLSSEEFLELKRILWSVTRVGR